MPTDIKEKLNFKAVPQINGVDIAPWPTSLLGIQSKQIADTMMMMETFGGPFSLANVSINGFLIGGWWYLAKTITIDRLTYRIGAVTGSAGAVMRLGIYATDALGAPTGAPLAEVSGVSGTAAINTYQGAALGASVQLQPGWYCPCLELQGSPATVTQVGGVLSSIMPGFPIAAGTAPVIPIAWYAAGSSNAATALPTNPVAAYTGAIRPFIWSHILSIP